MSLFIYVFLSDGASITLTVPTFQIIEKAETSTNVLWIRNCSQNCKLAAYACAVPSRWQETKFYLIYMHNVASS